MRHLELDLAALMQCVARDSLHTGLDIWESPHAALIARESLAEQKNIAIAIQLVVQDTLDTKLGMKSWIHITLVLSGERNVA